MMISIRIKLIDCQNSKFVGLFCPTKFFFWIFLLPFFLFFFDFFWRFFFINFIMPIFSLIQIFSLIRKSRWNSKKLYQIAQISQQKNLIFNFFNFFLSFLKGVACRMLSHIHFSNCNGRAGSPPVSSPDKPSPDPVLLECAGGILCNATRNYFIKNHKLWKRIIFL